MHDGCNGWDERDGHYGCYNHYGRHGCIANGEGRMLQGMTRMHEGWSAGAVLRARLRTNGRSEAPAGRRRAKKRAWRLPTLPHRCSTIGVRALDFRVRDGNGYFHSAMATKPTQTLEPDSSDAWSGCSGLNAGTRWTIWSSRSDD